VSLLDRFVQNAAILLALALIFDLRERWPATASRTRNDLLLGLLVGIAGLATMLSPVRVETLLVLDSRGILLAISGLFFGVVPTLVAMALTSTFRALVIGGPAASTGVAFIFVAGGLGLAWRRIRGGRPEHAQWMEFAALGVLVGVAMLALAKRLLGDDPNDVLAQISVPVLLIHAGGTLALGLLLKARITRTSTAAALAEREASFRTLAEQMPAVLYRAAADQNCATLYVSPRIASFGFTPEEWTADGGLWERRLHPDDAPRVLAQIAADRAAGRPSELVYRLQDASGEWRTVRDASQLVRDAKGIPLYEQGLMFDITAQERAAAVARLEAAALDAAADAVVITDIDGNIEFTNRSFTTLTGFTAQEAVGRNPRDLVRSEVQPDAFYKEMWDTLLAGNVWNGELVNRRKDGTLYTEEQTITPVRDDTGRITNFIAIKRDITARRALELQYQQSQKMEGIGRLAGGVAHDLNNLLTVINGTVELSLPSVTQSSELRSDLLEIRRAADRAAALTRQLLAFSRQQVLKTEIIDINQVVSDLLKMLSRVIGEDITIKTHFANGVGNIRADAGQLEQVVMNLTVNARDAMPNGGVLTIETRNVNLDADFASRHVTVQPGPHVALIVSDTGTGMDSATRARVFEPFYTTKAPGKGTGLGLSTVYGIVKQSGGSIWVYSEPGHGTTFKIFFPRVNDPVKERSSGPFRLLEAGGKETILVVEDEDAIRAVAVRVLGLQGYTVLQAASGADALKVVADHGHPIDLLMTDMVMPGMTGPELAQALLAEQPSLKVLFTSGYSADAVARQFGMGDDVHFISKPYGIADLAREVRKVLDGD
jgi:two-component system, cell cycle sensor histidine kinase and response regulator CckA